MIKSLYLCHFCSEQGTRSRPGYTILTNYLSTQDSSWRLCSSGSQNGQLDRDTIRNILS